MRQLSLSAGLAAVAHAHAEAGNDAFTAPKLTLLCNNFRIAEQRNTGELIKLGQPTKEFCDQAALDWSTKITDRNSVSKETVGLYGFFAFCRAIADNVAGRRVENAWCSAASKEDKSSKTTVPIYLEEVIWLVLDASPVEGIRKTTSERDQKLQRLLTTMIEPASTPEQISETLTSLGFDCASKKLLSEWTIACETAVTRLANKSQQPRFLFATSISIEVTSQAAPHSASPPAISVRTSEAHL
jgi:hypothetical protein